MPYSVHGHEREPTAAHVEQSAVCYSLHSRGPVPRVSHAQKVVERPNEE